ncbi:MAG TPA: diaminopimelate epimerase [Rhizobiales bacterium]|nr:diaminopimelate epimerase [Hyphomicrobiales bacterium]
MNTAAHTAFRKMNGLGNDFVVFDARRAPVDLDTPTLRAIAARHEGVGCDQIIRIEPSDHAEAFMRIWNADGDEVDACGNATRCIASLLLDESSKPRITIATNAGELICTRAPNPHEITVDMGKPKFAWNQIPLAEEFADTRRIELQVGPLDNPVLHSPSVVNVGNPHCLFWVDDIEAHDLAILGPFLENHVMFPERANISLAQITGKDEITLKVWERGAGLTRACGTAACAAGVAAPRLRKTGRKTTVILPGGPLGITWRESDDHILMTGAYELEYEGFLDLSDPKPVRGAGS